MTLFTRANAAASWATHEMISSLLAPNGWFRAEQPADLGRRIALTQQQHKVGPFGHAPDRLPGHLAQFCRFAIMDYELEHVSSPWLVW